MMTKRLFSIMLMAVLLIPFTIQAETIAAPGYKVDVTQPFVGIGLDKTIATNVVESTGTMRSLSHAKSADANIKMTSRKQKTDRLISQCASCHSTAIGIIGVPGGGSIGIRKLS